MTYIRSTKEAKEMTPMTPNDRIRQYLEDHGIKQSFLADKCGWTRQRACKIINGKQKMTVDDFDAVCDALNVPCECFLPGEELE